MSLSASQAGGFHQFKRLPPEVRDMIWRAAILPRIVLIRLDGIFTLQNMNKLETAYGYDHFSSMEGPPNTWRFDRPSFLQEYSGSWIPLPECYFGSPSTVPLMNTCRESRAIAKPLYSKLYIHGKPSLRVEPVLFDFARDTLYMESPGQMYLHYPELYLRHGLSFNEAWEAKPTSAFGAEDASKIQRLAIINPPSDFPGAPTRPRFEEIFQTFKSLQNLTIVNPAYHQNPRDLVQTGGIHNITDSLRIFELEESRFFENMELQRLAYEQEHCEKFIEDSPHEHHLKSVWNKIYDTPAPSISYETVTTRMRWEAYKEAKQRYDIRRDLYECSLQNHSVGYTLISRWLQEGALERRYLRD
jgi:hypothetical protein